jgi:hypothetical protein
VIPTGTKGQSADAPAMATMDKLLAPWLPNLGGALTPGGGGILRSGWMKLSDEQRDNEFSLQRTLQKALLSCWRAC